MLLVSPAKFAETFILVVPCWVTLAMYLPLLPDKEPLLIEGLIFSAAIPGTEIETGLSTPIYITFILSADTTKAGLATMYSALNGYDLIDPSGAFTLIKPPHLTSPSVVGFRSEEH